MHRLMPLRFDGKHFHLFKFNKHLSKTYLKAPAVLGARKWGRGGCKSAFKRVLVYWRRQFDIVLGSKALWGTDSNTGRAVKQQPAVLFLKWKLALFCFSLITVKQLMSENFSWTCGQKPGDQENGGACSYTQLNRSIAYFVQM